MKKFLAPHLLAVLALVGCTAAPPPTPAATDVPPTEPEPTAEPVASDTPAPEEPTATAEPAGGFVMFDDSVNRDVTQSGLNPALAVGSTIVSSPDTVWATWAENAEGGVRQIFVSELVDGVFEPRGSSLNLHQNVVADFPVIAFTGEGQAVPWVAWEEPSPGFKDVSQIFASRFNAATGLWQPAGQDRGDLEPSLNHLTNRAATNPAIAAGAPDPTKPSVPWIAWEEVSGVSRIVQIFVAKAVKTEGAIGGFSWEFVGLTRNDEPSLNADPARDARNPTIIFAETSNTVPWVTWHETGGDEPDLIFTARGVVDAKAPGGFKWVFVPPCEPDITACALNVNPTKDAFDAHMASGSVNPGEAGVPWIVWAEVGPTGKTQVLVSRLDTAGRNSFLNVGGSLNVDQNHDAKQPFIAFVGNVPYVAWLEDDGSGKFEVQVRHLASDPQTGTWELDTPETGFNADAQLSNFSLFATGSTDAFIFAWPEGDPAAIAAQMAIGQLKP